MKKTNYKYYVMWYDFNTKSIEKYNVLSDTFIQNIKKEIKKEKITTFNALKEYLDWKFKYLYHSKAECEMSIGGLFGDNYIKISMYDQIYPNLDLITDHIFNLLGLDKKGEK